jgi:hypothetical protein
MVPRVLGKADQVSRQAGSKHQKMDDIAQNNEFQKVMF